VENVTRLLKENLEICVKVVMTDQFVLIVNKKQYYNVEDAVTVKLGRIGKKETQSRSTN
jgi:hypothetical protein